MFGSQEQTSMHTVKWCECCFSCQESTPLTAEISHSGLHSALQRNGVETKTPFTSLCCGFSPHNDTVQNKAFLAKWNPTTRYTVPVRGKNHQKFFDLLGEQDATKLLHGHWFWELKQIKGFFSLRMALKKHHFTHTTSNLIDIDKLPMWPNSLSL